MKRSIDLNSLSDDELLELRLCDLPYSVADSPVAPWVSLFLSELEQHGLVFKPEIYFADEWLCPEGVPVIGIPFYLAHTRLSDLEKKIMLDVEGGEHDEFMRLIRHEMGHAVKYAYRLRKQKKWRELFGHPMREESDYYRFKKYSRNFVHNIENFYAQSHPDEDFSETFAVWLNPDSTWSERYKHDPVLKKLNYVNMIMKKCRSMPSQVPVTTRYFNIKYSKKRLKTYYKEKKKIYASDYPDYYDQELLCIFTIPPEEGLPKDAMNADTFFKMNKLMIINTVARWTRERKYIVAQLVTTFIRRAHEKKLICRTGDKETLAHVIACATAMVKNYQITAQFKEGE